MSRPPVCCNFFGWVHFNRSCLSMKKDYHGDFLCANCSEIRVLINEHEFANVHKKIRNSSTNVKGSAAVFVSRANLIKTSKCTPAEVDHNLNSSETYTKFKQSPMKCRRLKVVSFRLNEICSVDLADLQQLAIQNGGMRYLFVAVDVLSRYLWMHPMKTKTSKDCKEALQRIIAGNMRKKKLIGICAQTSQREKIGSIKGENWRAISRNIAILKALRSTRHLVRQSLLLLNGISGRLKTSFLNSCTKMTAASTLTGWAILFIINTRVNRLTRLAPKSVGQSNVPYLVSLSQTNSIQMPKFEVGDCVRIRCKIETFRRGYRKQFTKKLFKIDSVATTHPPT